MSYIEDLLFHNFILNQLVNNSRSSLSEVVHDYCLLLQQELDAVLTSILASEVEWRAFQFVLRQHHLQAIFVALGRVQQCLSNFGIVLQARQVKRSFELVGVGCDWRSLGYEELD